MSLVRRGPFFKKKIILKYIFRVYVLTITDHPLLNYYTDRVLIHFAVYPRRIYFFSKLFPPLCISLLLYCGRLQKGWSLCEWVDVEAEITTPCVSHTLQHTLTKIYMRILVDGGKAIRQH